MKNQILRNRILAATLVFVMGATSAFAQPQQARAEETTTPTATNTTFDTARNLQFSTSIAEELSSSDSVRYYKFYLKGASEIHISGTKASSNWRDWMYISDSTRTEIASFSFYGTVNSNIYLTGGQYYIKLDCNENLNFTVNASALGESFTETQDSNNDSINNASPITFGRKYKGVMACNDDKDYYKIDVPADGKVTINLTNGTSETLKYSIYDSRSNLSATNTLSKSNVREGTASLNKGTYYLAIVKNNNDANGSFTFTLSFVKTTVKAPSLSSVKNKPSKKMTVTWKAVSGVSGYQVQYSLKKKFKSGVKKRTIKSVDATTTTFSKLKKKKKYYVRVRAYLETNGVKKYSKWSKVKSVKIKK